MKIVLYTIEITIEKNLNFLFTVPIMLEECMEYLEARCKTSSFTYEVIVVSSSSKDGTVSLALEYSKIFTTDKFRVLDLIENRGKGGAVRLVN